MGVKTLTAVAPAVNAMTGLNLHRKAADSSHRPCSAVMAGMAHGLGGPWCGPYMPAGAEEPAPLLYIDRQGFGHFDLGPGAPTVEGIAPTAQKSVLDLVVEDSPPLDVAQAERVDAGAGMAIALRDVAAQVSAAEARARRDRAREALLVRAKGDPKAGCSKLWTAKRRAVGAVFQPAAYGR
ncbi:hypothetical protein WJX81_003038 [Elliptochloris bilobata]|uniref:Uncharacterized protein n=1 Tax=Elliptochloris bilobata TaxID=381761 RepID=A0AAW1RQX9_9CHLO